jgi:hypothetical protein
LSTRQGRCNNNPFAATLADAPVDPAAQKSVTNPQGSSKRVRLSAMIPAIFFCN